jgi:hypothetical protein
VAFEFEVWSGQGQDQFPGRRDELSKDAVQEFLHFLSTVAHWDIEDLNPFAQPASGLLSGELFSSTETLNQKASFNAAAAALHKTNRKQEFTSQNEGVEVLSMFKLLETGMLAGLEIQAGKKTIQDFPPYVDEVLREEGLVIKLMQARYNMLGLVLLGRMTKIQDSLMTGVGLKILHNDWKFDLSNINHSQLKFFKLHLEFAAETRRLLEKLHQPVSLDKDVKQIFKNLTMKAAVQAKSGSDLDKDRTTFSELIKAYIE